MTYHVTDFASAFVKRVRPDENTGTILRVLKNSEAKNRRFHSHLVSLQSALCFGTQIPHLSGG